MRSRQAQAVALVLLSALLLGAALTFILHLPDPLAQYRTADGGLRFFPAPKTYTTWESVRSPYPTLAILGTVRDLPQVVRSVNAFTEQRARPLVLPNIDLLSPLRWIVGLFVSDAAASCVGGNCFWIGGTGNFSNNAHWSLTSGGVTCVCTPGATDTVTFDGNSGGGTATQDNVSLTTGSVTIGAGTVIQNGGTWTVAGSWDDTNGEVFPNTSTVVFSANGSLRASSLSHVQFYNITINLGVTTTYYTFIDAYNRLTVNGSLVDHDLVGDPFLGFEVEGNATNTPLVVGASGDVSQTGQFRYLALGGGNSVLPMLVTATTYRYLSLLGENTTEIDLAGNISTVNCGIDNQCSILISGYSPGDTVIFDTKNHNITANSIFWVGDLDTRHATAHFGTSTVTAKGFDVIASSVAYLENATFNLSLPPGHSCSDTIVSYTQEFASTVHAGSASMTVASCAAMNAYTSTQTLLAETSTWTISGTLTLRDSHDTLDLGSSSMSVGGNWDTGVGTLVRGTSTVTLTASGTLTVNNDGNTFGKRDFHNLSIAASKTTTFTTAVGVGNVLTLGASAALVSSGGDAQRLFTLNGDASSTPLVLGAGADMSQSGYFVYEFAQASSNVTAAQYQHLGIEGGSGATATLLGNISTVSCGVYVDCAIIMLAFQPDTTFTVNSANFSIAAGGQLWLGDTGGFGVTFNAGSSTISAYGFSPFANNTVVNLGTATVTARPSTGDENLCFTTNGTQTTNFQNSTFNCYGQFRLGSGHIDAGAATINVIHDGPCMPSANCGHDIMGARSPGEVVIFSGTYIIMGSSTWRVDSIWQNGNTVAEPNWSAGTGTVTFHQTGINTDFNSGGDVIGKAEFHNMVFDFDVTKSDTMVTDNLWADGSVTLRNTHGASTTLDASTFTLRFGSLSVASSGATLGKDGFSLTNLSMSADTGTILLSAWTALDLTTPDVEWTFNPSTSSATVTVTKGGLPPNTNISLYRDGVSVDDGTSNGSGSITLSRTAGWSSHAMKIAPGPGPASGGGGGGTPPGDAILVTQVSGLTYKFSVQSNIGTVTSVSWDFGDGKTSSGLVVYHTFAQDGTYTITAQVTKAGGSTEPLTKTITVASSIPLLTMVLTLAVILMILAAFFVKGERRKFWLVAGAAAILAFDLTSYAKSFGSLDVVTALNAGLLLLAGIVSVVVGLLPTKEHRIRGKWLILGAVILISWWYLVLGGVL